MSKAEEERREVAASPAETPPSGWRSWFASTGQPPAWALVRYMVYGLVLGGVLGGALPQVRGTLLAPLRASSSPPPARAVPPGSRGAWR
jgi:hypothetical protein